MLGSSFLTTTQRAERDGAALDKPGGGPPRDMKEVREGSCFDLGGKCSRQGHRSAKALGWECAYLPGGTARGCGSGTEPGREMRAGRAGTGPHSPHGLVHLPRPQPQGCFG